MKKRNFLALLMVCVLLAGFGCGQKAVDEQAEPSSAIREKVLAEERNVIDARPFLGEAELMRGISEAEEKIPSSGIKGEKNIRALVAPHHAAAAALSARCIGMLASQNPSKVILLAPNHYSAGQSAVGTTADWQCYGRKMDAEEALLLRLSEKGLIHLDDEVFRKEHSVGMLMPLIAYYLPDAEVVPIIFHHKFGVEKLERILEALEPELAEGAVVIASIDFSHYLTKTEAEAKDEQMQKYLEEGQAEIIAHLGSDYVDSPTILAAMLDYFGTEDMVIIDNSNSGVLLKNAKDPCTSYFTIRF